MTTPTSQTVRLNDFDFCLHSWKPAASSAGDATGKGLVVIFHGFLAHGLYPTVRYAAQLLSSHNYTVVAPDLRGHGKSPGLPGYLPSRDVLLEDGAAIVRHCCRTSSSQDGVLCFLVGSSMGGTIALSVAQKLASSSQHEQPTGDDKQPAIKIAGVALLAPMLQLSVSAPARSLLWGLAHVLPTWQIIPSSSTDPAKQYRDERKRQECENDEHYTVQRGNGSGKIRIGSASTCVELANAIRDDFGKVTTPFLLLVADEDVVVNNQGDFDLYEQAPATTDKTMKRYPALHGLLCEPSPLVDTIQRDLLDWIEARS